MLAVLMSKQARMVQRLQHGANRETAFRIQLEQDLQALLVCSRSLAERFHEQTTRQQSLTTQVQSIAESSAHNGNTPNGITDAYRLLNEGLGVEQVAALCELSQGEAALLARWQQRRAAA